MSIITVIANKLKSSLGIQQDFDKLISNKDIDNIIRQMQDRSEDVKKALKEYEVATHEIMSRQDKIIKNSKGQNVRVEKQWRLPIPYQVFINEISLVFLYGRPVKFSQQTEATDKAFEMFKDLVKSLRFDSRIRQCKRVAGAETESALLLHVFRNDENKPDALLKVLAASKGDELRPMFDMYDRMTSFGRGYYLNEGGKVVYHFDIFTKDNIFRCVRKDVGWDVTPEKNMIGKIPIIYFRQEKEHHGVQQLIEREEHIASVTADVNDYFASPAVVITADVLKNIPEKGEAGKIYVKDSKDGDVSYLTVDSAPELKKMEIDYLQGHILSKSFTPNIDFETMKSLSNVSGKALKQMMALAEIKANKHKEYHDEMIDRFISLLKAAIGNVLDVSLKTECDKLIVDAQFQSPFGEDVAEIITNLVNSIDSGMMSEETGRELNPMISDSTAETVRINKERKVKRETEGDVFGQGY
ncbi:MAG: phage portal protein [Bacteroidales bacterium]|nr:phage portal protein [Bacteroidales bacterium]